VTSSPPPAAPEVSAQVTRVAPRDPKPARRTDKVRRQILLWARVSFLLVGSLPWWLPVVRRYLPVGPFWDHVDLLFVLVCHRLPERTLAIAGVAMPLCSRCAGICTGLGLGALVAWPRLSLPAARLALGITGVVMLLDVAAQDFGLHPLWHWTRLGTGIALGYLMSCTLFAAILREGRPSTQAG